MADDIWNIRKDIQSGRDTIDLNTIEGTATLTPQRLLLHETIAQMVAERKIFSHDIPDYDRQFYTELKNLRQSEAYKALELKENFTSDDVHKMLDGAGYNKLPVVSADQHVTMMVNGGPATGKTNLAKALMEERPDIFENAVRINPDDYKAVLADPSEYGSSYADMAHRESSMLTKNIMGRLEQNLQDGQAPHVFLDVVSPNESRMNLANKSSVLAVTVGTLPPEEALGRSYSRYIKTGRQTPTEIVLGGSQKVASLTPNVLDHKNPELRVYSTDVPSGDPPKLIAKYDPELSAINVSDPDSFADFIERKHINPQAGSAAELFPNGQSYANVADGLSDYTYRNVSVNFIGNDGKVAMSFTPSGVNEYEHLPSSRGNNFFHDVSSSYGKINVPDMPKPAVLDVNGKSMGDTPHLLNSRANIGMGATGMVLGGIQLSHAIEKDDKFGMVAGGSNILASGADVSMDAMLALGKNVPAAAKAIGVRANIAATVIDGTYQISQEEGLDNKLARGAAVTATAATAYATGTAVTGMVAASSAPIIVAAAPIVIPLAATAAVGIVADQAVVAYKATESLEDAISAQEQVRKVRNEVEPSGAPKLSNFVNLKLFAANKAELPDGASGLTPEQRADFVTNYEYSKNPAALDALEMKLQAKIDGYDDTITANSSWIHDSLRLFDTEAVDTKHMAQIDRAQYMAAMNELKNYKAELGEFNRNNAPQDVINHSDNIAAILPPGVQMTVQSSDGNASVIRGCLPDSNISLMLSEDNSLTLLEREQKRILEEQKKTMEQQNDPDNGLLAQQSPHKVPASFVP